MVVDGAVLVDGAVVVELVEAGGAVVVGAATSELVAGMSEGTGSGCEEEAA